MHFTYVMELLWYLSLLLFFMLPCHGCAAASPRFQRTNSASTTAECWGTVLTPTRELSTAWLGNVTSVITTEKWQTRLKTTSGWRYSVLHFDLFVKQHPLWRQTVEFLAIIFYIACTMLYSCSWTRCALMMTAAALLRTDWPFHSYRNSCWRTMVWNVSISAL